MALIIILFSLLCCPAFSGSITKEIPPPHGYKRVAYPPGSYAAWLRGLPVKEDKKIRKHDGGKVWGLLYRVYAVVKLPLLFTQDLEQCADFSMRFWAEHHKAKGMLNKLYLFDYGGNKKYFRNSKKSFKKFLKWCMAYSNSHSIKKGCRKVEMSDARPGDMFVQNKTGGIGHVSVIVDACENEKGEKLFLVGYSFMPAQEFHIEKAKNKYGKGGWFSLEGYYRYLADHYLSKYGVPVMRRF